MSARLRLALLLVGCAGFAALFLWGAHGLPGFGAYPGPYGTVLNAVGVVQRHATDLVTAVNFDYRAVDTVGEEFILFTAVAGVTVVLRHMRGERQESPRDAAQGRDVPEVSDAVRVFAIASTGPLLLLGWYIVAHGQISPGGGFQGGVILASAFFMVYLAGQFIALRRVSPEAALEAGDALGAGGFVVIGLAALLSGAHFLQNVLPLGTPGTIDSAGTMGLVSFAIGLEVTAALVLVVTEFLDQTLMTRGSG